MNEPGIVLREAIAAERGERDCPLDTDLWVAGSLAGLRRPTVAIVGTRAATAYGRRLARAFAADLGSAGCCIVSGLALGIDAAAHEGALNAKTPTIGVLGSGHDRFFPPRNAELAERIVSAGGAVVSPFPPGHGAMPWQFLQRNGVVAALSDAVVVIEAPARSGALNTAGWAAGRIPVFAVPGDVDRAHVAGCHALIRDGAILARNAADVLEALRIETGLVAEPGVTGQEGGDGLRERVLHVLAGGDRDLDTLAAATGSPAPELLAVLAMLEMEGAIVQQCGRYALDRPTLLS